MYCKYCGKVVTPLNGHYECVSDGIIEESDIVPEENVKVIPYFTNHNNRVAIGGSDFTEFDDDILNIKVSENKKRIFPPFTVCEKPKITIDKQYLEFPNGVVILYKEFEEIIRIFKALTNIKENKYIIEHCSFYVGPKNDDPVAMTLFNFVALIVPTDYD